MAWDLLTNIEILGDFSARVTSIVQLLGEVHETFQSLKGGTKHWKEQDPFCWALQKNLPLQIKKIPSPFPEILGQVICWGGN